MKYIYADPPYVGQARKHYKCEEINHAELIMQLQDESDGWALSCSSPSLPLLLPICPDGVRVMAWVKPFSIFKPGVNPSYSWEPVIVKLARKRTRQQPTVRDWVSVNITLKKGLVGAKPPDFCFWLFEVLNLTPEDEFVDMFPGTGIVGACWEEFKKR
jgi:hypothetical protein